MRWCGGRCGSWVTFRSNRMRTVSPPVLSFEKDSGETATRMNMTKRTGTAAMATQIVMQVAKKTRALREKTLHNMDA